jgi:prepilin-type N-terminal cleavage/methylation domain-containing protein
VRQALAGQGGRLTSRRRPLRLDERGLTLVELLVSMLLLGVILAAAASGLITFSRTAVDNERRILATALNNRLHEDLQATPWIDAVNYEAEVDALADLDALPDGLFLDELRLGLPGDAVGDARELVIIEGPSTLGCPADDLDCNRRDRVPRAYQVEVIDEQRYEIFQFVTWEAVDPQIKRFTTIVRWQVLNTIYEERFESTRAATGAEAGDPTRPRVIQFQVGPSPSGLDEETGATQAPLNIVVRFSNPVGAASVRFFSLADPSYVDDDEDAGILNLVSREVALTATIASGTGFIGFEGTIPAGAYRFPNGARGFQVVGTLGGEEFLGTTAVEFRDGPFGPADDDGTTIVEPPVDDDDDASATPPAQPVTVGTVTRSPGAICTDTDDRFATSVEVQVTVTGMTSTDYDVAVTYTVPGNETRTEALLPVGGADAISPAGHVFSRTFAAGQSHGFVIPGGNNSSHQTTFTVTASRRSDSASAGPVASSTFTVTKRNNPNPSCT